MKRFLITSALILCLPAMAAEKPRAPVYIEETPVPKTTTTKPPADMEPNAKTGGGPLISPEQSAKMTPAEAAKHATKIAHPLPGPLTKPGEEAPLGAGQTLAPGQADIAPVVAPPPPPPLPHGPPVGMLSTTAGSTPNGWADCEKTHAAEQCKMVAISQGLEKSKFIVKLPESGKIEDLDKFLDDVAASKTEMKP